MPPLSGQFAVLLDCSRRIERTLARLIDSRVLSYVEQTEFERLYKLIRQAEQTLNGFMSYVRKQRTGSQEYGDRKIQEDRPIYEVDLDDLNENRERG